MNAVYFFIEGDPTAWKRAGRSGSRYFDKQINLKEQHRTLLMVQGARLSKSPIELKLEFLMSLPKSISKKERAILLESPHIKKPDIDNLEKYILDVGTGVLWFDDKQVFKIQSEKKYADEPMTKIWLIDYNKRIPA